MNRSSGGGTGSLTRRLVIVLFVAVGVTQAAALAWVFGGRAMLLGKAMLDFFGPDVAASVAILERVPPQEREQWLPRISRPNYAYRLQGGAGHRPDPSWLGQRVSDALRRALGPGRPVQALLVDEASGRRALVTALADGTPVTIELQPISPAPPSWIYAGMVLQLAAVLLAALVALRGATRSLRDLARAADAADPDRPAGLAVSGPSEVQRVATAFNAMQQRVAEHIAERARLLAAIAHDLQTPITRMKLRAEMLADEALRHKTLRDLDEMQSLVEQGMAYARAARVAHEAPRRLDLTALLDGLVCDRADAGDPVEWGESPPVTVVSRPEALRRIVDNLLGNAVKYAGGARVALRQSGPWVQVTVSDDGPGIPADRLDAIKQPFERLEGSRNRDTGGAGLGLAIADELARAVGGHLTLANRPGGGLDAVLQLPAPEGGDAQAPSPPQG